jgi:hypothetical protein
VPQPIPDPGPPRDAGACAVEAFGVVRVPLEEIPALRKVAGPLIGHRIPPSLLKHADEQTVLALAAVLRAIHDARWQDRSFAEWGLIAAPRFLGRLSIAPWIDKYARLGASTVSPLIIPNLSLHAVAGSLSLALRCRGFNFGVGGGHGHLAEALLAGLAASDDGQVPGLWVVATEWDPEPIPDGHRGSRVPAIGTAVALALVPGAEESARRSLRVLPVAPSAAGAPDDATASGLPELAAFLESADAGRRPRSWYRPLPGGGAIVLDDDPSRVADAAESGRARA